MQRRDFILQSSVYSLTALGVSAPTFALAKPKRHRGLDEYFAALLRDNHIPGVAAILVSKKNGVLWSNAYGWADIENKVPMALDTIQNIGSISKTVTATAAMQLQEKGLLDLDRDINEYLPIELRHPAHPDTPITTRQLMIHTSALRDGSNYSKNYACGDSRLSLSEWVKAFFMPGGAFYNPEENFQSWAPGEKWTYCNVSFSVLALVVESVSGLPFPVYCHRNIFSHLKMKSTDWMLSDIDQTRHAIPYSWIDNDKAQGGVWGDLPVGVVGPDGPSLDAPLSAGYHRNCLYSHPNYPDGFLRTSVNDLSRYLLAYLNGGIFDGRRILTQESVREMLTPQLLPQGESEHRSYGLTWYALDKFDGELTWGHGGGDPGVNTAIVALPEHEVGMIVFLNTYTTLSYGALVEKMLGTAVELAAQS